MMNYEKIILEMLSRIKDLEEKVDMLQDYMNAQENNEDDENEELDSENLTQKKKESGRKLSRQEIMRILKEQYNFNVRKGNRSEGSGIVATRNGKSYNIKVSYSRSYFDYVNEEVICSGWHTLFEKEINNPDFKFFIFIVADAEQKFHYFIFRREDIIKKFDYKVFDANNKWHFYFRVMKDGKPLESREIEKDMSAYYNNWDIFKN